MLEATLPDDTKFVWLFDAKYRIKSADGRYGRNEESVQDMVPDDAINQMHRYRDALIHLAKVEGVGSTKSRPVFGAYALYPGYFNQPDEENPYATAINEVGIGAFSLLPDSDHKGSYWLRSFLICQLGGRGTYTAMDSDRYFVEEASRISSKGTSITRYADLTILASQLGPNRNPLYIDAFKQGEAQFYHTKLHAFERQKIEQHIAMEARYLAVAVDSEDGVSRKVEYIYPIIKTERVKRKNLKEVQTGTNLITKPEELFWLFTLGKPLRLKHVLVQDWKDHFQLKLVSRDALSDNYGWDDLPELYSSLVVPP